MTCAAVPSVLQNGVVVYQNVKNAHELERILVAAPVTAGTPAEKMYTAVMLQRDPQTQRLYLHDAITEKELDIRGTEHLKTHRGSDTTNSELYTTDILRNALHVNTEKFSTARPTHIKRACGIASQTLLLYMYDAVLRRRLTSRRRCRSDRPCCRCSGPDSRRWYSAPPPWARPRPRSRSGASPWCHRRT